MESKSLAAATLIAGTAAAGATYAFVNEEQERKREEDDLRFVPVGPNVSPVGEGSGTKKGGYAVMKRLNGANKRQRAARKVNRRTRNGQHL